MSTSRTAQSLDSFATFGALLRYLRRSRRLTQRDLAIATGYSEGQICRLEQNQRLPDLTALAALFVPALELYDEPELVARLVALAAEARQGTLIDSSVVVTTTSSEVSEVLGALESSPPPPSALIDRPALAARLGALLAAEGCVILYGLPGCGKTTLAAAVAGRETAPVFWMTFTEQVNATSEALLRQIALFLLASGDEDAAAVLPRSGEPRLAFDQQVALLGQGLARLAARSAAGSRAPAPLLCLDNAHAANDPAVLQALAHLSATAPMRLLLISREMLGLARAAHVALTGLEPAESQALIERLRPSLAPRLAERLAERTAGNPMLLRLALGLLGADAHDPAAVIDQLDAQPEIAVYLSTSALQGLSADGLLAAGLLAVLRQPIDLHDELMIEQLQSFKADYDLGAALADLQRRHLINAARQASLHPLLHDHLYAALGADPPRRRKLHHLAAEWCAAGGDLIEAAHHYGRAGEPQSAADVLADQGQRLINLGLAQAGAALIGELLSGLARRRPPASSRPAQAIERTLRQVRGDLLVNLGSM